MKKIIFVWILLSFSRFGYSADIKVFHGKLFINGKATNEKLKIKEGDEIEVKGRNSFFILKYADGTQIIVKNGKLKVDELKETKKKSSFSLARGIFGAFVKPDSKHDFKVKRKNISFGVRGTKFYLDANKNYSYLCVCEGEVLVQQGKKYISVFKGEDLKTNDQKLSKSKANDMMWAMAVDLFKKMDIKVEER